MNSTTLGAVMEKEGNERAHDEIEKLVTADLISDWKEPSTRGDLRNFAIRMDSQFGKLEREGGNAAEGARRFRVGSWFGG